MLKTIIYVCPDVSGAVGGIKAILRHAEILNGLADHELPALVYVPDNLSHAFDWLEHKAVHKDDHAIQPASDFIVPPGMMAARLGPRLADLGVRYAIFVQNGYYLFEDQSPISDLAQVYAGAALVMSTSQDTTACIERAFPFLHRRVLPMWYAVDPALFYVGDAKQDAIAYMSRKLPSHARAVTGFLSAADLTTWELVPIKGMFEVEVAAAGRRTRIFLSFSHLEGFGLPQVEAALAGNLVVSYTGEGGNEYWFPPRFTKVESGNIRQFVDRVQEAMRTLSDGVQDPVTDPAHAAARADLARTYSREAEIESVRSFAREACAFFEAAPASEAVSLLSREEILHGHLKRGRDGVARFIAAGAVTALSPLKRSPRQRVRRVSPPRIRVMAVCSFSGSSGLRPGFLPAACHDARKALPPAGAPDVPARIHASPALYSLPDAASSRHVDQSLDVPEVMIHVAFGNLLSRRIVHHSLFSNGPLT